MILTLAWKEFCEHRSIWLTMVVMTCILSLGLAQLVGTGDAMAALVTVTLAVLCMAGAYGVVCGAMMFAGEHEGGTLVFLDIFLGRRGLLWLGKAALGVPLALSEGLAVAVVLVLFKQQAPTWAPVLVGIDNTPGPLLPNFAQGLGNGIWLLVLPIVTLEAYVWGLFGSALTRRVLTGAALAAAAAAPVWLGCINAPAPLFLGVRVVVAFAMLALSFSVFVSQSREKALGPPPKPEEQIDEPRRRLDDLWDELQHERQGRANGWDEEPADEDIPVLAPIAEPAPALSPMPLRTPVRRRRRQATPAGSPFEALLWLTFRQAWAVIGILAAVCFLIGLFMPSAGQVLWPCATLLLGVGCGVAAFAPEQRDLSYQFLAAAHLPLRAIWRFKLLFWFCVAVAATALLAFGGLVVVYLRAAGARGVPIAVNLGTLRELLGPVLFFSIWLVYGFCTGQVVVWLCRKSVLAVLLSALVSAGAVGLWLPSLLCGGMSGWQLWLAPLALLSAGHLLVRAWAGGRIKERRPALALGGFAAGVGAWALLNFGYRAWEVPDVGMPVDRVAYKKALPSGEVPNATKHMQAALGAFEEEELKGPRPKGPPTWPAELAAATKLPPGILELPRSDGQAPMLQHLNISRQLTARLCKDARGKPPERALDDLAQVLALSRTLRHKAPEEGYRAGVTTEQSALDVLDDWRTRRPLPPALLRRALDELNRHAEETPSAVDCLQGEAFRAAGLLENPTIWNFSVRNPAGVGRHIAEPWLARAVVLSLEMPWEAERRARLWQLVWAGLLRAIETPHWEAPPELPLTQLPLDATRRILHGWLPATNGRSRAEVAALLEASWLTDERLFAPVVPLRDAATQSAWRVAATRLALALALYQADKGQPAAMLDQLVPKYLPKLPVDPYSGAAFHYRVSTGEHIDLLGDVRPGQGVLWSTGPDRLDHGGRQHGARLNADDPGWRDGAFDLVTVLP